MDQNYWQRQQPGKPLFPDLIWSRPENAVHAGKLLIIGGNLYGFAKAANAYAESQKAGVGVARVILPDALQKTVGRVLEAGEYAPSTPSGSFSQRALGELLPMSQWADGVLIAGDLGRNSETAILLEKFASSYSGQLTLTCDATDYFTVGPAAVLDRPETLLAISVAQLQKIAINSHFTTAFTFDMDMVRFTAALHEFSTLHQAYIIVRHLNTIFVAAGGRISSTKLPDETPVWRLKTATHAAVWWLQNPSKPFEALTTAVATVFTSNPADGSENV